MNSKIKWNILIFPGGMENGLEIQKSLRYAKEIHLVSASSKVMNHAFYVYKNNHVIRAVNEPGWIDDLNEVIKKEKIDLVYPANSLIIDHLSAHRDKLNAPILLPDHSIIELTRSKHQTLKTLRDLLPIPKVFTSAESITSYPVFAKPDGGYGSQGALMVNSPEEARQIDFSKMIVQELLPGKEYTVDCFSDRNGKLHFSGARERSRVRMATSMHAETVPEALELQMRSYAEKILSKIKITGAWFFQVKEDQDGRLKLLEIDIRIAGTMCFNRTRGVNFPLLSIFDHFKYDVDVILNPQPLSLDRCLKNRYIFDYDYDTVYVDLDDTLIVHGQINTELMQYLYQCVNNKKKIVLISKSLEQDKVGYLKSFRIFEIFDEIFWLKEDDFKADYMKSRKSLYIDDSYSQRKRVQQALGIPTFDTSMVEGLLDDRY